MREQGDALMPCLYALGQHRALRERACTRRAQHNNPHAPFPRQAPRQDRAWIGAGEEPPKLLGSCNITCRSRSIERDHLQSAWLPADAGADQHDAATGRCLEDSALGLAATTPGGAGCTCTYTLHFARSSHEDYSPFRTTVGVTSSLMCEAGANCT